MAQGLRYHAHSVQLRLQESSMPATLITSLPPTPTSSSTPVQPANGVRAADKTSQGDSQGFAKTLDNRLKQQDQKPADNSQATSDAKDTKDTKDAGDKDQTVQDQAAANPAEAAAIAAGMLAGADKVAVDDTQAAPVATGEADDDGKGEDKGLLALGSALDKQQPQGKDTKVAPQDLAAADKAAQDAARNAATDTARKTSDAGSAVQSSKETSALASSKSVETREAGSALRADAATDINAATTQAPAAAHSFAEQLASKLGTAQKTDAPQFSVPTPVGNSAWAEDVGNRIVWMAGKDLGKAELILTPPHLGRVEISLSLNGDQASASFVAATPAAREALEQALPKLRDLMSQAGIDLSQANVSANNSGQQGAQEQRWSGRRAGGSGQAGGSDSGDVAAVPASRIRSGNGLVDTFA
jgi:flagellar hook-length control protein FliK